MAKAKYIAITCDIWSRDTRSFIAANAHWISDRGKLETAMLACKRFTGNQTADEIAAKLREILNRFEILSKCVAITTDNASNFKSCLKKHSDDYMEISKLMDDQMDEDSEMLFQLDLDDLQNEWCRSDQLATSASDNIVPLDSIPDSDEDEDATAPSFRVHEMPSGLIENVSNFTQQHVLLPNRIDCAAHTFNLIGKNDAMKALHIDAEYRSQYVTVFKKLNAIWRVNSTRLGRETFKRYLKKTILKPHRIRWNRIYDAVKYLFIYCKSEYKYEFQFLCHTLVIDF